MDQKAGQGSWWVGNSVSRMILTLEMAKKGSQLGQEETIFQWKYVEKKTQPILLPEHCTSFLITGWVQRLTSGGGKSRTACPWWSSPWKWPREAPNWSRRDNLSVKICKKKKKPRPSYSLSIGPVFSSLDGSKGWQEVVVSREQHAKDDPHTGYGQEKLPASARSTYLSMRVYKKNHLLVLLPEYWNSFLSTYQARMDPQAGQGSW